jgi:cell wall-associated NlpC family hydrolase
MAFRALSSDDDAIIRSNLKTLQKQTRFKVPNIDVPVEIETPNVAPSVTGLPAGGAGGVSPVTGVAAGTSADIPIPPTSKVGEAVVKAALQMRGVPYSWGGGGPGGPSKGFAQGANTVGFDCSSLVQYAFSKYGVNVPRVTYDQFRAGTPVPVNAAKPGDLMFFSPSSRGPGHVGIYVGNGQFLHAPQTGDVVKLSKVSDRSDLLGIRRFGAGKK